MGSRLDIHPTVTVGDYSIVGADDGSEVHGRIGAGSSIGSFCHISASATIGDRVEVDHYVRVGSRTVVGDDSKLLYNARIFNEVRIGRNCIVSGDVPNFVVIEDDVTFMADVAHSHRNADRPWVGYDEPSPIIRTRSVVGLRALLVGPVEIGPRSYVAAGELVRHDVPPDSVLYKGEISPLSSWKGLITVRSAGATDDH